MYIQHTKDEAIFLQKLLKEEIVNGREVEYRRLAFNIYENLTVSIRSNNLSFVQNGYAFTLTASEFNEVNSLLKRIAKPNDAPNYWNEQPNKIPAIKLLRSFIETKTGRVMGLKDAKEACENPDIFPNAMPLPQNNP